MNKEPCFNEDCDKCDPRPRWIISEHRIQHITYKREIKASTQEEALAIYNEGTSWPSSYDEEGGEIIECDPVVITPVTDERTLEYYRTDCCTIGIDELG